MTEDGRQSPITSFEDLEVFQRAYDVSLSVHKASLTWPQTEQHALANQMRRASKSVCANIAEGFAKQTYSTAEFRRYIVMAIGSADETRLWCRYCRDLGYIDQATWQSWHDTYRAIARMLHGLHRSWR